MKDFYNFLESKDNYQLKAVVDLADAIKHVFKKYSLNVRKMAWEKITSEKGQKEIDKIIRTPERSTSTFRTI